MPGLCILLDNAIDMILTFMLDIFAVIEMQMHNFAVDMICFNVFLSHI